MAAKFERAHRLAGAARGGGIILKPIYTVMVVNLVIWAGIFIYLLAIDNKLKRIEKK